MDIETSVNKKRSIDLEESPFGHAQIGKMEGNEPSLSYLCVDLFHIHSAKKSEQM